MPKVNVSEFLKCVKVFKGEIIINTSHVEL